MITNLFKTIDDGRKVYHITYTETDSMLGLLQFLYPDSDISILKETQNGVYTRIDTAIYFAEFPMVGSQFNNLSYMSKKIKKDKNFKKHMVMKKFLELTCSLAEDLSYTMEMYTWSGTVCVQLFFGRYDGLQFEWDGKQLRSFGYFLQDHEDYYDNGTIIDIEAKMRQWEWTLDKHNKRVEKVKALFTEWVEKNG